MTPIDIALALACLSGMALLAILYAALIVSGNHNQAEEDL